MIRNTAEKLKAFFSENKKDLLLSLLVLCISSASFGLGRLSALWPETEPVTYEGPEFAAEQNSMAPPEPNASAHKTGTGAMDAADARRTDGEVIASKSGSAYHLPSCPGAQKIKEENRIVFATVAEARKAGYHPAANCTGLR